MTTFYVLVDYENVQPDVLPLLQRHDTIVIVFIGAGQKSVPVSLAAAMQAMGERARYVQIEGQGKNALDFHIAFYIGDLLHRSPGGKFYIISKDTGFDPLILHLHKRGIDAQRLNAITNIPFIKNATSGKKASPSRNGGEAIGAAQHPCDEALLRDHHRDDQATSKAASDQPAPSPGVTGTALGDDRDRALPGDPAAATLETRFTAASDPKAAEQSAPTMDDKKSASGIAPASAENATPQGETPACVAVDETIIQKIIGRLQRHEDSRPRTIATLRKHLPFLARLPLNEDAANRCIAELQQRGILVIGQRQMLTYRFTDAPRQSENLFMKRARHDSAAAPFARNRTTDSASMTMAEALDPDEYLA